MALPPLGELLGGRRVVLASGSPRRRDILSRAGFRFDVVPSRFPETLDKAAFARPGAYALETARAKALEVARRLHGERRTPDVVVGADTVVVADGLILEKPMDEDDARGMLARLSGREHRVVTGVAVLACRLGAGGALEVEVEAAFHEETAVTLSRLSDALVREYVASGEPMDKAGGYAAQARGGALVEAVRGDFLNAVGFPLNRFCKELAAAAAAAARSGAAPKSAHSGATSEGASTTSSAEAAAAAAAAHTGTAWTSPPSPLPCAAHAMTTSCPAAHSGETTTEGGAASSSSPSAVASPAAPSGAASSPAHGGAASTRAHSRAASSSPSPSRPPASACGIMTSPSEAHSMTTSPSEAHSGSTPSPFPASLLRVMDSFKASQQALSAACRLGVFDLLRDGTPRDAGEVASDVGVSPRGARRVLEACAGLGLLQRAGPGYAIAPEAQVHLTADAALRAYVAHCEDLAWDRQAADREDGDVAAQEEEEERAARDLAARVLAELTASRVARAFDLGRFRRACVVVASAPGRGALGRGLALADPRLTVTDADAGALLGPAPRTPLPEADLYVLARPRRAWADEEATRRLLEAAAIACGPGSALLLAEVPEVTASRPPGIVGSALEDPALPGRLRGLGFVDVRVDAGFPPAVLATR